MNSDASAIILEYATRPPNKGIILNPTFSYHEKNRSCGDSLTVFVTLEQGIITDFAFDGDTAIVTTAAAAIFGESILGLKMEEVLTYTYQEISEMIGGPISPKRQIAACLGLLATRNGIHTYLQDGIKDDFSDVLPG